MCFLWLMNKNKSQRDTYRNTMCVWSLWWWSSSFLFSLIFSSTHIGLSDVRVVALNVPSQVRKGSEVELSCLYDLGGGNASLYSLKWFYRANDTDLDEQEFFRYTPTIKPYKQFFPLDGVNVNVNIIGFFCLFVCCFACNLFIFSGK